MSQRDLSDRFWLTLEKYVPWLGTPGVLKAVVMLNALTFLLITADPTYAGVLGLLPEKVLEGEVWRLITYIFIPQTRSWFWVLFLLLFMWFLASALEEFWGALKLNVFYLLGMIGCTVAAFFFGGTASNTFLNTSLFFAFATIAPNYEIYLFFVLRVKVKYIAWVTAGFMGLQLAAIPLPAKMAMLASLANYLIFFAPGFIKDWRSNQQNVQRRKKFQPAPEDSLHRCHICGRTDASHPGLEFRVAADGEEYCDEHLPKKI
jgi:membrane associated rhomboid family serine protease